MPAKKKDFSCVSGPGSTWFGVDFGRLDPDPNGNAIRIQEGKHNPQK
jgi:hypothetical protein